MRALRSVTGSVAILDRPDVDTDQIIPKQFLKRIERSGYGQFLFFDWMKDPAFELHAYPGRVDPARRAQLRLRLVARACGVGARGLRVPGRDRAVVRRHLPHERDQDRACADRRCRRRSVARLRAAVERAQRADRRPRAARRSAIPTGCSSRSSSIRTCRRRSCTASTTSRARCSASDAIAAFEATHAPRFDTRALAV